MYAIRSYYAARRPDLPPGGRTRVPHGRASFRYSMTDSAHSAREISRDENPTFGSEAGAVQRSQKPGESSTSRVKISRRPSSMAMIESNLPMSLTLWKV